MIVHLVSFKVKPTSERTIADNCRTMKQKLDALPSLIPEVMGFEVGININPSEAAFDVSLYSTFETLQDLETYNTHPEHLKVVDYIKTVISQRVVVDYQA